MARKMCRKDRHNTVRLSEGSTEKSMAATEKLRHRKKGGGVMKRRQKSKKLNRSKVVSYIHVGDAGKEDLERYLNGNDRLQLELFCEEDLPDMDVTDVINGLDQVGTSIDFCDEKHRCSRACPVGCQGHLRPNEVIIYEGVEVSGRLSNRKRFKGRFITREVVQENKKKIINKSKKRRANEQISEDLDPVVGESLPQQYLSIINGHLLDPQVERDHAWSSTDRSFNLTMKTSEHTTVRRQPVTQSTDGVRGKVGSSRGVYIYEITWPVRMRGTHAAVGVATKDAPLHSTGYQALIGCNENSWGWDIGRKECVHDGTVHNYPSVVRNHYQWTVPDNFYLIIDMDQGSVSFAVEDKWLGVAFDNLQGRTVFPAISTVWGHAEISIRFVGTSRRV